ncbi:unnamed protein product [Caretta caretta]
MDISTKQLRQNTEKSCQKRWGCEIAGSAEGTTQKDTKNKCYCIARIYIPSVSRFHGLCEKLLKTTTVRFLHLMQLSSNSELSYITDLFCTLWEFTLNPWIKEDLARNSSFFKLTLDVSNHREVQSCILSSSNHLFS